MEIYVKKYFKHAVFVMTFLLMGVMACRGQDVPGKVLPAEEYGLWGTLHMQNVSPDGRWVSYSMSYQSGVDTLFIKGVENLQTHTLAKASGGRFIGSQKFAYFSRERQVQVLHLLTGRRDTYNNVLRYERSGNGKYLITLEAKADSMVLILRNSSGIVVKEIENVTDFSINNSGSALLYNALENTGHTVGIVGLGKKCSSRIISTDAAPVYGGAVWKDDNKAVAFYSRGNGANVPANRIHLYRLDTNEHFTITEQEVKKYVPNMDIAGGSDSAMQISDDGQNVFFPLELKHEINPKKEAAGVEVWDTSDNLLYPMQRIVDQYGKKDVVLGAWFPEAKKVTTVNSTGQEWVALIGDGQKAIIASPHALGEKFMAIPNMDYHINDIKTGSTCPFLSEFSGQTANISVSPSGNYIAYYKDSNWWVYTVASGKHENVTQGIEADWDIGSTDPSNTLMVWGAPGWTSDGNLLLYDSNDIWSISTSSKVAKRLTNGKHMNLRFRLADYSMDRYQKGNYSGAPITRYDFNKTVYLTCLNIFTNATGYYCMAPGMGPKVMVMDDCHISNLKVAANGTAFFCEVQTFESAPRIIYGKNASKGSKTIAESNKHQRRYQWGTSEMIHYTANGKLLNGALFYPAGYLAGKKYPMVVYIYEIVSRELNKYVNPSLYNSIGFNITNLTAKGYLVLLPDISFEASSPGLSATACVEAAVHKVIDSGIVKPDKIGLVGHSFGGYETNFILTQSSLFAAAVSGASVSDIVSSYFTYGSNLGTINNWRYEDHQFRIGKPFYQDVEVYLKNSPILHARNITTPLLTWAGKDDDIVESEQSMEFYAALRRLNKKNVMLLYLDEKHTLDKPENQKDLTTRLEGWFGYYLKDERKPSWMKD